MINNSFIYQKEKLYLTVNFLETKTGDLNRLSEEYKKDYVYNADFILTENNKLTLAYTPWDTELNLLKNVEQKKYIKQLLSIMYQAMFDSYFFDPLLTNFIIYNEQLYIINIVLLPDIKTYIKHWYIFLLNIVANKRYTIDNYIEYKSINEYFDRTIPRKEKIYLCSILTKLDTLELIKELSIKENLQNEKLIFKLPEYIEIDYNKCRDNIKLLYDYYYKNLKDLNCNILFLAIDLYYQLLLQCEKIDLNIIYNAINHYIDLDNDKIITGNSKNLKYWEILKHVNLNNSYYHLASTAKQLVYIFREIILPRKIRYYYIDMLKLKSYFMRRKYLYRDFSNIENLTIRRFNELLKNSESIY